MKRITRDQVLDLEICYGNDAGGNYSRDRASTWLDSIWPEGRDEVSIEEIAACEDLKIEDRLWVIQRRASPRVARLFACDCAKRALDRGQASKEELMAAWLDRLVEIYYETWTPAPVARSRCYDRTGPNEHRPDLPSQTRTDTGTS